LLLVVLVVVAAAYYGSRHWLLMALRLDSVALMEVHQSRS
jgi:hypothetical protein